jgi:hypothetical protein
MEYILLKIRQIFLTVWKNWQWLMHPKILDGLNDKSKGEDNKRKRSWGTFLNSWHFGSKGACWSSEMGPGQVTSKSIIHVDLHKPKNKLVNTELEHFWSMNEAWANTDSQDSPHPELGGSHHLPLYSTFCAWPRDQHSNVILLHGLQNGSPKIPKIGTFVILEAHNVVCRLPIKVKSKTKL